MPHCGSVEAENGIKELQRGRRCDLFGCRARRQCFVAKQLRPLSDALACTLMQAMKRLVLAGSECTHVSTPTIRTRLPRLGANIRKDTCQIRVGHASNYPVRAAVATAARRLSLQYTGCSLRIALPRRREIWDEVDNSNSAHESAAHQSLTRISRILNYFFARQTPSGDHYQCNLADVRKKICAQHEYVIYCIDAGGR